MICFFNSQMNGGIGLDYNFFTLMNISKTFEKRDGEVTVVDNIQLSVKKSEFICIMGSSGCGKSTLMKIMGGIEKPTSGRIYLNGVEYENGITPDALSKFGYVFQNNNLLDWRTTAKNVRLPLEIFKLKGEKWNRRVDEMLDIVGLLNYKGCYPYELSGGMRQRVGIARSLVHDPEVLLLDQPFGALDAITRKLLGYVLLNIWEKTQKTIIMVTNNIDEALLLSSRVFVLSATPAKIAYEFQNDIPISQRDENLQSNDRFNELRAKINHVIRSNA